ncbi:uncharacterized mitochondrial protein-like protein [Tanacetum coccineum]
MVKPVWNNAQRVNHQNFAKKSHPYSKKNLVPRSVLMKSGLVLVNTTRQVNTAHSKTTVNAARPMSYLSKIAHSTIKRPIHKNTTFKNSNINQRVNTVRGKKINTARPKAVVNAVKGNNFNVVKASACWGNPQMDLQDQGVIDSGCSRHMTGNMSYLTDYEEIDGGYVAFGGNPKGGKITGKVDYKVKVIRCDNRTEFKNREMNQFCEMKGILRQFSIARTPQQNRVAKRRNKTLIEAARTMLADSKLPTTFWAEAVNTACYVQNRVLVVKPHNKTPYELFHGRTPTLSFMRPFGCPVTILNTIDHLGKFDGKADEGFFVGYSLNSKAFRVFNSRIRIVEENLHIRFRESTPNVVGSGPDWLFDINALTRTMNYEPIVAGTQSNGFAGTKASDNAGQARKETELVKDYILLPLWTADLPYSQDPKSSHDDGSKPSNDDGNKVDEDPREDSECEDQEKEYNVNNTNNVNTADSVNTVCSTVNAASTNEVNAVGGKTSIKLLFDPNMPALEDDSIFYFSRDDEDDCAVADMNNLDTTIQVSPNPTTRIHKDHPLDQVIVDLQSTTQIRKMSKNLDEHGFVSTIQQRTNHKDLQNCLFACFLSQEEPKKVIHALKDPSWIEAMQEELLQFKLQEVWTLVDLPNGKRAIGSKWVFRNKKDETIRLFLAYASFKDFVVYQIDVKSDFLNGKIEEEVYVCQPPGFKDPNFPDRVYKSKYVDDIIFGSTKKELCNAFEKLMHEKFQMSFMGELTFFLGLQVQQKKDGIFISQDKYVVEILKKFGFTEVKTASKPMETQKPLLKDEDVCACARYQVNPKVSHLHAMKRIFRYLKGQPKLGLWYPKDSPFDLVAYTNSDYARASLDRKSTTGGKAKQSVRLMMEKLFGMELELILFWSIVNAKTINGEVQLHVLVDGKKIIVTKSTVRRDLQLEDAEGIDCLPNSTIFEELTRMGFVQVFLEQQLDDMSTHKRIYIAPSHNKKIFRIMRRVAIPTDPHHTPTIIESSTQPQKTQKPRKSKRKYTQVPQPSHSSEHVADEAVHKELGDSLVRAATTASSLEAEQDSGNITKT